MSTPPALIVLSHLRWDFVFQRPQQLMSRLARHFRVFFVEEPIQSDGAARLVTRRVAEGVTVVQPHTSVAQTGFHDDQLPVLVPLLSMLQREEGIEAPLVWLYTPMALPIARELGGSALVYDCMDELSAFLNAPRQLIQRENALLRAADLVFTGGPSLYRAKQHRHPSVHCFPSSVDAAHFAAAREPGLAHEAQQHIQGPRLGFYGVIDERFDLALLDAVAVARPDWQLVMVGPVVKIDEASLPRRANIHYLGQRTYDELPALLAGWDVCLLPFALNDATRYISPTKTLEYMAAGRPVVSTPITDVAVPYGNLVEIAHDAAEFIAACERQLALSDGARAALVARMEEAVRRTSWDETVQQMRALVDTVAAWAPAGGDFATARAVADTDTTEIPDDDSLPVDDGYAEHHRTVVVGAGPTGLSAAYHLGEDSLLIEQEERVGGWCRSIEDNGFTFDFAGHIMFSNDPYVHDMYRILLGDNVHWQDREAWVYSKGVHTRYPFQGALYGLPPDVLKDCIVGAIEARFGPLKAPAPAGASTPRSVAAPRAEAARTGSSTSDCKAETLVDCCADGVVETLTRGTETPARGTTGTLRPVGAGAAEGDAPRNFEEFIYRVWGAGVAKHFAIPYNRKLWAVPLTEMETSWLGGRVPMPDLEEMIAGALRPVPPPMGPNARFGYPLRGGFQALMDGFLPKLRGGLRLGTKVAAVDAVAHELTLDDGTTIQYDQLVSTMPLPKLIASLGAGVPAAIREAVAGLRHVSVRCVNLGVAREAITEKHWIYYPEDPVFHRVFVQGNASPHCNPPGGFGLTCEITYSPDKPLPCDGDALMDRCIRDCIDVGLLREEDVILARNQVDMPYAYVVYDHARAANVRVIRDWLLGYDIFLAGRYSEWEYYNSDHAFIAGRNVAATVREAAEAVTLRAGAVPA